MRIALIGFGAWVAMSAGLQPAAAAPRPFCMLEGGNPPECLYYTFQQCYESAKGLGGYCYENPELAWQRLKAAREPAPRRTRARRE